MNKPNQPGMWEFKGRFQPWGNPFNEPKPEPDWCIIVVVKLGRRLHAKTLGDFSLWGLDYFRGEWRKPTPYIDRELTRLLAAHDAQREIIQSIRNLIK